MHQVILTEANSPVCNPREQAGINIKPGSGPNCSSVYGHDVIPVAILGSDTFDVTTVDQSSLLFGGLQIRVRGKKGLLCGLEYANGHTYLDLVCHFEDDANSWDPGDGEATLTGVCTMEPRLRKQIRSA